MDKWEYQVVTSTFNVVDQRLDELGQQGWELVSVVQVNPTNQGAMVTLYLKRRKS
ncbi:MAG: DUF4177 domain-containing protein [Candidatus Dormibacteraceae bacterium]